MNSKHIQAKHSTQNTTIKDTTTANTEKYKQLQQYNKRES
jgi:hypothetical protein